MGWKMKLTKDDKCYVGQYNRETPYIKLSRLGEVIRELEARIHINARVRDDDCKDIDMGLDCLSHIDDLFGDILDNQRDDVVL